MTEHVAIMKAIIDGDLEIIKVLIELDPLFLTEDGETLLSLACLNNQPAIIKFFVNNMIPLGVDFNVPEYHYLRHVINNENLEILQFLVQSGFDVHQKNPVDLYNPLILASSIGNIEIVQYLVEIGCDIHSLDDLALKAASNSLEISTQHNEVIKYLVQRGINVNMQKGWCLNKAVINNNVEIVQFLIDNGADLNINDGICLTSAAFYKNLNMLKLLVENGADVNINNGWPLQLSARDGNKEIVQYLINQNADVTIRDSYALILAVQNICDYKKSSHNFSQANHDCENIVNILVLNHADIHTNNDICLLTCAQYQNKEMIAYFLHKGCHPSSIYDDKYVNKEIKVWVEEFYFKQVKTAFFEKISDELHNDYLVNNNKKVKI